MSTEFFLLIVSSAHLKQSSCQTKEFDINSILKLLLGVDALFGYIIILRIESSTKCKTEYETGKNKFSANQRMKHAFFT